METDSKIDFTFEGHFTPQDKKSTDYHYVPFDVPENVSRIDVRYDFTRANHAARQRGYENILDIGLFDPYGHQFNGDGFRGWSGGARAEFFVSLTEATPGYLPGSISAGTWHIILGLYQIAPAGCDYQVTVTLTLSPEPVQTYSYPAIPFSDSTNALSSEARWYRGDLHTHTHHSDAEGSITNIINAAQTRGLDFLAIMDHNTVSHLLELPAHHHPGLLLIPGMEVTTYYGHANIWGLRRWVDFRCRETTDMQQVLEVAQAQQALFSINHPNPPLGERWEYGWMEGANAIEVWNGLWHSGDYQSLLWWDELLQTGRRIVAVAGSDQHEPQQFDPHFPCQVGTPTSWIYAQNLSIEAILAAVRAGHLFITTDIDGPQVRLTATAADGQTVMMGDSLESSIGTPVTVECEIDDAADDVLELVQDGQVIDRCLLNPKSDTVRFTWAIPVESNGYIRAQIVASTSKNQRRAPSYPKMVALTNPIYIRSKTD